MLCVGLILEADTIAAGMLGVLVFLTKMELMSMASSQARQLFTRFDFLYELLCEWSSWMGFS